MSSYQAKDDLVRGRQLKVQRLAIPFVIVGSATPASLSLRNDEPSIMYLRSAGNDQITSALSLNETAVYSSAPSDVPGVFNILIKLREPVEKVVGAMVISRVNGVMHPCFLGSATGISTGTGADSGKDIMLTCDASVALNAPNTLDACLEVLYVVQE